MRFKYLRDAILNPSFFDQSDVAGQDPANCVMKSMNCLGCNKSVEPGFPACPACGTMLPLEVDLKTVQEIELRSVIDADFRNAIDAYNISGNTDDLLDSDAVDERRTSIWKLAADRGWPEGQYLVGLSLEDDDFDEALKYYRDAAFAGLAIAQTKVSSAYLHGTGVSQDTELAKYWAQKGASQDHALAQFQLAFVLSEKFSTYAQPELILESLELLAKAAEQDCTYAQYHLGHYVTCIIQVFGSDFEYSGYTLSDASHWLRTVAEKDGFRAPEARDALYLIHCMEGGENLVREEEAEQFFLEVDQPAAVIRNIWFDHYAVIKDAKSKRVKGMRIHASIRALLLADCDCTIAANIKFANTDDFVEARVLTHKDYREDEGYIEVSEDVEPSSDNMVWEDMSLELPYKTLKLPKGEHQLQASVQFIAWDGDQCQRLAYCNSKPFNLTTA